MTALAGSSFPFAAKRVTFTIEYHDVLTDPTDLIFAFGKCVEGETEIDPDTAETFTYGVDDVVVRVSEGVYSIEVQPTLSGYWGVQLIVSGSHAGAHEVYFRVLNSHFVAA